MKGYIYAWKRGFDFGGRSTREEYFGFLITHAVVVGLLWQLDFFIGTIFLNKYGIITSAYQLIALAPILALNNRRLNDINKGMGWLLINLLPIVGNIIYVVKMLSPSAEKGYYPKEKQLPEAQEENRGQKILLFFLGANALITLWRSIFREYVNLSAVKGANRAFEDYYLLQFHQLYTTTLLYFSLAYVLTNRKLRSWAFVFIIIVEGQKYLNVLLHYNGIIIF